MIRTSKVCKGCSNELPRSNEFFYTKKDNGDGLTTLCKNCTIKRVQEYRKNNPEKVRETDRKYWHKRIKRDFNLIRIKNIHTWIRKHKKIQNYCTICNTTKKVQLANISGKYQKDPKDFLWLCRSCHILFDKIRNTHKEV